VRRAQGPKPRAPPLAQIGRSTGRDGPPGGGGELSPAHPRPSPGRPSPARAPPALSRGTGWPDACAPAGARGGGTASGPASGPAGGRRGAQGAGRRGAPGGAGRPRGRWPPRSAALPRRLSATAPRDGARRLPPSGLTLCSPNASLATAYPVTAGRGGASAGNSSRRGRRLGDRRPSPRPAGEGGGGAGGGRRAPALPRRRGRPAPPLRAGAHSHGTSRPPLPGRGAPGSAAVGGDAAAGAGPCLIEGHSHPPPISKLHVMTGSL